MGLLGSKDSRASMKSRQEMRRRNVELLGRQFRRVKYGLDPEEVMEFLESVAGTSEAALKRLEQFAAFQKFSRTMMENVVAETKQLAEHAKAQAQLEAERVKTQAREEAKRQVEAMLDEARKSCIAAIDSAYGVLLEGVTRAQEMEKMAFEKAREMVANNLEVVHRDIHRRVEATLGALSSGFPGSAAGASDAPADRAGGADRGDSGQEPLPSFAQLGSEEVVESASKEEPVAVRVEEKPEPAPLSLEPDEGVIGLLSEIPSPRSDKAEPVSPEGVGPEESAEEPYEGDVTLIIPSGVTQSWMRKLRQRLLDTPGVYIRLESGGDTDGTIVNLLLDRPVNLLSVLREMPSVRTVLTTASGGQPAEASGLLRRNKAAQIPPQTSLTILLDESLPAR